MTHTTTSGIAATRLTKNLLAALLVMLTIIGAAAEDAQAKPTLTGAASRMVHGAAGTFDLPLNDVPWNPTTEPRIGPAFTVVFTFESTVTAGTAAVTEGTATPGAPTFGGNSLVVPLTAVADAQYVTVTLSNVSTSGGGSGGGGAVRIGFLAGDANQSRIVAVSDLSIINAQLAQPVSASNFLLDLNASGSLTSADISLANADLGHFLPAPGTPPKPSALKQFAPGGILPGQSSAMTITLNPKLLFVPNSTGNSVSVVNTADNTIITAIPVGTAPLYAAVNADGTRSYVTNVSAQTVTVIDTATRTPVATIPVTSPRGIAVNPAATFAYVANNAGGTVTVINTTTNAVTATVPVGASPFDLAVNAAGTRVYVPNFGGNTVTVLDTATNTAIANVTVGSAPKAVAANPAARVFYAANSASNSLSVVNAGTNTVTTTVTVGTTPIGVSVNPSGTRIFVSNYGSNSISVVDTKTNSVIATIPVGVHPSGVAFSPAGTKAYVANNGSGTLSVIDTTTNAVSATITVGGAPTLQSNSIVAPFAGATTAVSFNDSYPAGMVNTSPSSPATTCGGTVSAAGGGNYLTLTGGNVPANDSCLVSVNVTAATIGAYTNSTGPVASTNAGTGPGSSASLSLCGLPSITLTSPNAGQAVSAPATFTLSANASTASGCGTISKVDFFDNGTLLATLTGAPYTYIWTNVVALGSHVIQATARDSFNQSASASVTVTVIDHPPTIVQVTPTSAQTAQGGSVTFMVTATDPDAGQTITVKLLDSSGTTTLATGTLVQGNVYSVSWTPPSAGAYVLKVQVVDNYGGASAPVSVNAIAVALPVPTPPAADQVIPASYPTPLIGTIGGTFAVGDSGAASYSIPIQVPPGTASMQPNLALAYNSQGGFGHLGVGWNLSGLSSITRCPKTPLQDGTRAGINYDGDASNDAFCLDGQRLVRVAGPTSSVDYNNWAQGFAVNVYEYRTELDSFARIQSFEDARPNPVLVGPHRFRVWTKSGQVMDYGSRFWILTAGWTQSVGYNNSLQNRVNVAKLWALDRVIDRSGNFMEIDYADRALESPGDPNYQLANVLHQPSNCNQTPGTSLKAALATPIGALPNVEFWPTAIRYYAKGAVQSECGSSLNNQVRFKYEDILTQMPFATRDRYYDSGAGQTSISKRLIQIETSVDGTGLAKGARVGSYILSYVDSWQSGRSLLQSVTQCGADSLCLPATQFAWAGNDPTTGWYATGHTFTQTAISPLKFSIDPGNQGDPRAYVVDWNGDGKSDVVGWLDSGTNHALYVCLSTGSGFNCGATPVFQFDSSDRYAYKVEFADVDNDGRADLLYAPKNSGNWTVCLSDGAFGCTNKPGNWTTIAQNDNNFSFRGDIDGDGRIDIITNDTSSGTGSLVYQTCLAGDTGFTCYSQNLALAGYTACPFTDPSCETFNSNHGPEVLIADVNGDGKADLLLRRSKNNGENQWKVCLSDFDSSGTHHQYICHDRFVLGPNNSASNNVLFDFNGDGLVDLAAHDGTDSTAETWRVCLSTGDGAFEFTDPNVHWNGSAFVDSGGAPIDYYTAPRCRTWMATAGIDGSSQQKAIYGDFNGDGRTDIAAWYNYYGQWKICLSTGSAFSCYFSAAGPTIPLSDPDLNQWLVYGDFNGDGKTDILMLRSGSHQLWTAAGPATGDVVTKITTGLGATTAMTYAPLTDGTVYADGSGAVASQHELDIQSPMYVVKQTQASDGVGGVFKNDYFYEGLRGRTDGRGLYGFAKKRIRDGNNVVTESEYYRVAAAAYPVSWPVVGRPSIVRKYAPTVLGYVANIADYTAFQTAASSGALTLFGGSLRLVNRATNTWEVRNSTSCGASGYTACGGTPAVVTANLSTTAVETWELNGQALPYTTTSTPFASVDAYGNPQQVTVSSSDGYIKQTLNTYVNDVGTNWLLGRLTTAVATITKPGVALVNRKSAFTYHGMGTSCTGAVNGQLCDEIVEPDFVNDAATFYSLWQKTSYQYDTYGNRQVATVYFKDRNGVTSSRSATSTFGNNGRFPTTVINALGQKETRTFDFRWGVPTSVISINNIKTNSLYDGFGRKYGERVFDADGNRVSEAHFPVEALGLSGNEKYRVRTLASGGAEKQSYFDSLQREVRTVVKAFNVNTWATATVTFDSLGRKVQAVKPAGSSTVTTNVTYDVLNRPVQEITSGTGVSLTTAYAYGTFASITLTDSSTVAGGPLATITQSGTGIATRSTAKYANSQGLAVRIVDGEGGYTDFVYDPYGNLTKTIGPPGADAQNGITETMTYDRRGRKLSLSNLDTGSWSYEYDGAGQLVRQIDGKSQVTKLYYDPLGRVIERREYPGDESKVPFVTVSSYDANAQTTCLHGIGKLCEVRTATVARGSAAGGVLANPDTRKYSWFDAAGRPYLGVTKIDGRTFETFTTFDANGRVDKLVYPSGYMVVHRYTAWSGHLDQVAEWTGTAVGAIHWQANSRFADGQIQAELVGSITTNKGYDGFGRVASVSTGAGAIQNATYAFDAIGNLTSRQDLPAGQATEALGYDRLNRLTSYAGATASYYPDGNFNVRAGSTYTYYGSTHRVFSGSGNTYPNYDPNGSVTSITNAGGTRTLIYTPFNLPTSITGPGASLSYVYDGGHARIKEISSGAASSGTTYYLGGYEEHTRGSDNVVEQRHYLGTPEGTVGIYTLRSNGSNDARYWHKDHIGSVVVITDAAGSVKQKFRFDAWGNRTQVTLAGDPFAEERGYTGHEQLVEVGLVHMNGRIYDPVTARFLQGDPLIQDPFNSQSYNRYSYVLNNPLSFTDPTGFSFWTQWRATIISIAIVAVAPQLAPFLAEAGLWGLVSVTEDGIVGLSTMGNILAGTAAGFASGGIQGGNIQSALYGAVTAGASAGLNIGIGDITGSGSILEKGAGVANIGLHAALGCAEHAAAGGSCKSGAMAGGFSALAGPFIQGPMPVRIVANVLVGGVASKLGGGKFQNGAITAAFGYLFNCVQHGCDVNAENTVTNKADPCDCHSADYLTSRKTENDTESWSIAAGWMGIGASAGEFAAGTATVGTNWVIYSAPRGNQYFSTLFEVGTAFKVIGAEAAFLSIIFDYQSAAAGKMSYQQATLNSGIGLAGLLGPITAIPGSIYFIMSNHVFKSPSDYNAAYIQGLTDTGGGNGP